ncbi:MAG: hypothetical protein ACOC7U_01640 [Spirochaetota bacterium]
MGQTANNDQDNPEQQQSDQEDRKIDVNLTRVTARISPEFEITLPSGNVYQHFTESFNNLEMTFDLNYNFLNSNISGGINFAYPMGRVVPGIKFFQELDFENYFTPRLDEGELVIIPSDKYILRKRGVEPSISFNVLPDFYLIPSFTINDTFKGSLTTSEVIEEGIDLTGKASLIYDGLVARNPEKKLLLSGVYYRSTFSIRYRDSFRNPVSIDNTNHFISRFDFKEKWYFGEKLSLNYPLKIWTRETAGFYTLGGFDTIRGYEYSSINSFRFLLLSTTMEREIMKGTQLKLTLWNLNAILHQFRFFLLFDQVLSQKNLDLRSQINSYSSIGCGLSFVISGKTRGHFKIEIYAAKPLEPVSPLLYFKTSLYSFEKRL